MKVRVWGTREVKVGAGNRGIVMVHEINDKNEAVGDSLTLWFSPETARRLAPGSTLEGTLEISDVREPRLRKPTQDEKVAGVADDALLPVLNKAGVAIFERSARFVTVDKVDRVITNDELVLAKLR